MNNLFVFHDLTTNDSIFINFEYVTYVIKNDKDATGSYIFMVSCPDSPWRVRESVDEIFNIYRSRAKENQRRFYFTAADFYNQAGPH